MPAELAANAAVVTVRGRVLDGDGQGVPDAILEIWRADENGNFPGMEGDCDSGGVPSGFARIATNEHGEFEFRTLKPGAIRGRGSEPQAPHLTVLIFMRGLLRHLLTRIYFPHDSANDDDAVLRTVPKERRNTLIAAQLGTNRNELQWNVSLQGNSETVFFEV